MIAAALPAMRPDLGPFGKYAGRRAHRILLPWAVWTAVYGLIEGARYLHSGTIPNWTVSNLLIGTSYHLWFFVYIFFASLAIWWMLSGLRRVSLLSAATTLSLIAAPVILINAHYPPFFDHISPFGIWWKSAPAILLGVAFGLSRRMEPDAGRRAVCIAGGATLVAALAAGLTGSLPMMLSYGIPGILIPLALLVPWKKGAAVEFIADVSMGIYASHPLMLLVVRHFWGDTLSPLISAPAVFVGALLISKAIKRLPGGRLLV
jgi:peptidoglycan/LPS O-acetylase OafA/YrhL